MKNKKNLLIIIGPPATGKMTIGNELSKILEYKLFHNHKAIDPFLDIFDFNSVQFQSLVAQTRDSVIDEFLTTNEKGLILTKVINFKNFNKFNAVYNYAKLFKETGGKVYMIELLSSLKVRKERNKGESRLLEKSSKRNIKESEKILLLNQKKWTMTAPKDFDFFDGFISINNSNLEPEQVVVKVLNNLKLLK